MTPVINKEIDQILAEDVFADFPEQGLRFIECGPKSADNPYNIKMILRNAKHELIELEYMLDGSSAGRRESIKRALLNHPLIRREP